jgi:hypothetical protein
VPLPSRASAPGGDAAAHSIVKCPSFFSSLANLPHEIPGSTDQNGYLTAPCYRLGRVEAMLVSIFIPLRSPWRRAAVHPAAAVRHRRRLARHPMPGSGQTAPCPLHVQEHGVDPFFGL